MKNFDKIRTPKPDLDFTFGGQEYHAKGRLNWDTLLKFQDLKDEDGKAVPYIERVIWFVGACLSASEREKFNAAINDEDDPKSAEELDEIATWLIEGYVGAPKAPSTESSAGASSTPTSSSVDEPSLVIPVDSKPALVSPSVKS